MALTKMAHHGSPEDPACANLVYRSKPIAGLLAKADFLAGGDEPGRLVRSGFVWVRLWGKDGD